jgi:hypothetical protein
VLKKLAATGIVATAATGVMLLGGPANADRLSADQTTVPAAFPVPGCYYAQLGAFQPSWCSNYLPTTYYPPVTYYPGYQPGWGGWHHRYGWNRFRLR